jgi:catechol 2,3-dioxygenase-like lactoylglutathione lyase family enzyme
MPKSGGEEHNAESFTPAQLDAKGFPAPSGGFIITHLLIVSDQDRSRKFYSQVLGGEVIRQRDPAVVRISNSWIVIDSGGGPTDDKPDVIASPPRSSKVLNSILNIRVADVWSIYREWQARGAEFLTEPKDQGKAIRCYVRDPDGHLIEVGQSTGLLGLEKTVGRGEPLLF